jgi:hypothetical protein
MFENELKTIWQNSSKEELMKFNTSKLLIELDSKLESFDRRIKIRDRNEIIAAAIIIPVFGIYFFYTPQLLAKIGLSMGVLFCILVMCVLTDVKKYRVMDYSLPIKEYLAKHRQYLVKQKSLLENVLYWYILPPTVSAMLFFIGKGFEISKLIMPIVMIVIINAFIYYINKRAVKEDIDPLIKKLDFTIKDFETAE